MIPAQVITDFRVEAWWVTTSQCSDSQALRYLNRIRRWIIERIKELREWYFYQEWTANTSVVWQSEYTIPVRTSQVDWCNKLTWVSVKYKSTDTDFIKLVPQVITNLDKDLKWYEDNTPPIEWQAFFLVNDNSYFIYPAPTEALVDSIIVYWIADPIDVVSWWTEASIRLPLEYHDLLILWMKYLYLWSRWVDFVWAKNDALVEFNNELNRALMWLSDRIDTTFESEMPYINNLW